ncbi:GatB/YqeY domain-containing protein [Mahella australiensis]|uniref:GatB/YqeY domain protein n=1 Tax=Mahella australiensis (strain DSM 15567 / CIP 107919 / 50-1 BON) TaxID=697281 RepID=F4A1Q8_MAHA5|nr:GatB/YqeY domain-containing protein [Mahella australiensis]AEE97108.1 GatB/YqeY domain protein [Mahella australiensis 50-1 BON]
MSLKEQLLKDMQSAMKSRDNLRKTTISMARAAILQVEKDKQIQLDDDGVIDVLAKEIKSRKDAIPEFERGNRPDLVQKLEAEIAILNEYMPKQLSSEEISRLIDDAIAEVNAQSVKDIGAVMKVLMPRIRGRADGAIVNQMVKARLQ